MRAAPASVKQKTQHKHTHSTGAVTTRRSRLLLCQGCSFACTAGAYIAVKRVRSSGSGPVPDGVLQSVSLLLLQPPVELWTE